MGNWFSISKTTDDIIEDICCTDKFATYQIYFEELNPPRELYVEDGDITISTTVGSSYSLETISPVWGDSNVEEYVYRYLDNIYAKYSKGGKIEYNKGGEFSNDSNKDNNENSNDNINSNNGLIDFIENSVTSDIDDWYVWLDNYFDTNSFGYRLFKAMAPLECKYTGEIPIYSQEIIWFSSLESVINQGYQLRESTRENILIAYPYVTPIEVCDLNGNCVVIVANINGEWKYVGITEEYMELVQSLYDQQTQ